MSNENITINSEEIKREKRIWLAVRIVLIAGCVSIINASKFFLTVFTRWATSRALFLGRYTPLAIIVYCAVLNVLAIIVHRKKSKRLYIVLSVFVAIAIVLNIFFLLLVNSRFFPFVRSTLLSADILITPLSFLVTAAYVVAFVLVINFLLRKSKRLLPMNNGQCRIQDKSQKREIISK